MGINAVAVLRIEPSVVEQALVAGAEEGMRVGANGEPVKVTPLGNATLVHLGASIAQDPVTLGRRLEALLGEVLVAHDEPRGVPLFPESYSLNAQSWDDAVAELGDGAEWIELPQAQPAVPDLAAMLGAMGGMDALNEQLQGAGGAAMLEQAMAMAQQLAQSGALDGLAQQLQGAQSPEDALQKMGAPPDALGGLDLEQMAQQAQAMLQGNPDLEQQLRGAFGEAAQAEPEAPEGDDEADDGDDEAE